MSLERARDSWEQFALPHERERESIKSAPCFRFPRGLPGDLGVKCAPTIQADRFVNFADALLGSLPVPHSQSRVADCSRCCADRCRASERECACACVQMEEYATLQLKEYRKTAKLMGIIKPRAPAGSTTLCFDQQFVFFSVCLMSAPVLRVRVCVLH